MGLSKVLPFAAVTFTLAGVASMGLPGFSGFVAELQVLIGAWHTFPTLAVVAGLGILVGVAYTLRALQKAFFGESDPAVAAASAHSGGHSDCGPITLPERLGAVLLLGVSLAIGLFPDLLLRWITPSFQSPLFEGLRKGGLL
jgi:NADH-quinone oxidoreductase subunit M